MKKKVNYVGRPSQITKRAPSERLRKRRKKNLRVHKKGFFPNPSLHVIRIRKGAGPVMHFDGRNFTQRARVKLFTTREEAERIGYELLRKYPILRKYRMTVGTQQNP